MRFRNKKLRSLPSRERGLKSQIYFKYVLCQMVAPLAGAWIEIIDELNSKTTKTVAPLAGAWIEIPISVYNRRLETPSLPSRERGLKYSSTGCFSQSKQVAPLAGAWIEIDIKDAINARKESLPSRERGLKSNCINTFQKSRRRSPRGSVD